MELVEHSQKKEQCEGVWVETGEWVVFSRLWGGHRFTDQECAQLLAGEEIAFSGTSAAGQGFDVFGVLGRVSNNRGSYLGFKKLGFGRKDAGGRAFPPRQWGGHVFTEDELVALQDGRTVSANDFVNRRRRRYSATVRFGQAKDGQYKVIPEFSNDF